ncbi:MarR family winged helix-turn-helix transcriptional regulator [Rhodoferax bucti]|uniref:MarR family winged helix-turn-helix transcriptional regulator n=1 Tax=Rhodoferax bucti TaxID=2576305 RepID=UPI00110810D9|nr:MarR family winged helix-turn-helix transcriptional regulator [Rhodoferax bucti]
MQPSPPPSNPADASVVSGFVALMTIAGRAQQLLKTRMQDQAVAGLGPLHMHALCLCQQQPGAPQQVLVQALGRDKGQMARLIRDLEDHGLLTRSTDERDRRVWRLYLTPDGEARCAWFTALEAQVAHDLMAHLSPDDSAQLNRVLQSVQGRVDGLATASESSAS